MIIRRLTFFGALIATSLLGAFVSYRRSSDVMAAAAQRFLAALSDSQRTAATFPLASDERLRWHFIPNEMHARKGLTIKSMNESQRQLAHAFLKTGLSQRGYLTVTTIIELENVLQALEGPNRRFPRDPEMYWFAIFGTPADRGAWGWRFEGHHLSLHFAIIDGRVIATAPTFLGSNPAEVREGPKRGTRALGAEEDAARALVEALTPAQRSIAVIATEAPNDILTTNKLEIDPLSPVGVRVADLTAGQRELLLKLIDVYTSVMTADLAMQRLAALRAAGLDGITFAWAGGLERGAKHYYRVQGPTFLIEYDNTQNDGNHIHSVWRDFAGDFGRDALREHLRSAPH
jgi:hypothetical protein